MALTSSARLEAAEGGVVVGGGGAEVALELIVEGRLVLQLRQLHGRGGATHLLAFERRAVLVCGVGVVEQRLGVGVGLADRADRGRIAGRLLRLLHRVERLADRGDLGLQVADRLGEGVAVRRGGERVELGGKLLGGVGEGLQAVGGAAGAERDRVGAQRDRRGADVAGGALQGGGGARVGEGVGDFARPVVIDDRDRGQSGDEADADQRDAKRNVRRLAGSSHGFPSAAAAISPRLCGVSVNVTSTLMSVRRRFALAPP